MKMRIIIGIIIFLAGISYGLYDSYKNREQRKNYSTCKKEVELKGLQLQKMESDISNIYLTQFVLESFDKSFVEFEKIKDKKDRERAIKAFFQYKDIILSIHKNRKIHKGYIDELKYQEKLLCEQTDCSEFRKTETEQKKSIEK